MTCKYVLVHMWILKTVFQTTHCIDGDLVMPRQHTPTATSLLLLQITSLHPSYDSLICPVIKIHSVQSNALLNVFHMLYSRYVDSGMCVWFLWQKFIFMEFYVSGTCEIQHNNNNNIFTTQSSVLTLFFLLVTMFSASMLSIK